MSDEKEFKQKELNTEQTQQTQPQRDKCCVCGAADNTVLTLAMPGKRGDGIIYLCLKCFKDTVDSFNQLYDAITTVNRN
jgi:hypothetical protein